MGEADREGVLKYRSRDGWYGLKGGGYSIRQGRQAPLYWVGVCVLGLNYASKFIELRDERGMRGRGRHRKGGGIID